MNQGNLEDVLASLPYDALVEGEIQDAVLRGFVARVSAQPVTHEAWTGVGYLLLDEETGEAAYQLQGVHSGGVTVPAVNNIPSNLVDTLITQGEEPAPEGSEVVAVARFPSTDFQIGIVDKAVAKPLRVQVSDADGHPVPKAVVTFAVVGGGGLLLDPAGGAPSSQVLVQSNERGEAQAILILGKRTDAIPRYTIPQGDEWPTQVGLNLVTARAGVGALDEPFTAIALPDEQFDGELVYATYWLREWEQWWLWANLRLAGRLTIQTTDQHGNPLANWPATFRYRPDPELVVPDPSRGVIPVRDATTTPGRLLSPPDFEACRATHPIPRWGQCAGEAGDLPQTTETFGKASAYVLQGDSPYSMYTYEVDGSTTPRLFTVRFSTGGRICSPAPECKGFFRHPGGPYVQWGTRLFVPHEAYPWARKGRSASGRRCCTRRSAWSRA